MTLSQWFLVERAITKMKDATALSRDDIGLLQEVEALPMAVGGAPALRSASHSASFIGQIHKTGTLTLLPFEDSSHEELWREGQKILSELRDALSPTRTQPPGVGSSPEQLSASEVERVLLPLAIYFDQLIADAIGDFDSAVSEGKGESYLIQHALFRFDDGGDRFYRLATELLNERAPPKILLKIYYFCLKSGFLGRYDSSDAERGDFLEQLAERIARPVTLKVPMPSFTPEADRAVFPLRYYGRAIVGTLGLVLALSVLSRFKIWQESERMAQKAGELSPAGPLEEVRSLREVAQTMTKCHEDSDRGP